MVRWILDIIRALFTKAAEDEKPRPPGLELHEAEPEPEPEPAPEPSEPSSPPSLTVTETVPEPEPEPEIEDPDVMMIGAWTGQASLANPERDVAFCVENGIGRLDVIVNDHSARRTNEGFDLYDVNRIGKLVRVAQDAGLEVHFMSWLMPYEDYIEEAAKRLVPLCNDRGVKSIQWDAEEPWTQGKNGMAYPDAAKKLQDAFADLRCQMGANAIGYTPAEKFGPLTEIVDYVVPQCYATSSNNLTPATVVPKLVRRWQQKFTYKKLAIGLAAYRQSGIDGYTTEAAMQASFASAQALEGVDAVIYWSLRQIQASATVTRTIRKLAAATRKPLLNA